MNVIDLHCDTLTLRRDAEPMVTVARLRDSGALAQCFAIFFPTGDIQLKGRCARLYEKYLRSYRRLLSDFPDELTAVSEFSDFARAQRENRTGALLTVEDAGMFCGDLSRFERAFCDGVRMASLTWNFENALASPNSKNPSVMARGLKPAGFELLEAAQSLGVVIDVSHLSDGGFYDVADSVKGPFIASHSNARALCAHQRNLTDDMIKRLAEQGGVMGLNLYGRFLGGGEESRLEDMVRHVMYIYNLAGADVLALGSDFDGFKSRCEISGPHELYRLFDALSLAGLPESAIEKMCCKNILRVFSSVLKQ